MIVQSYPQTIFLGHDIKQYFIFLQTVGIVLLKGAPYHPATNGAAERLVQTFKKVMKKSNLPPRNALQEFLMVYRRTPLANGSSPSELLNGRQIRAHIDLLLPSPVHLPQSKQSTDSSKVVKFSVGDLV